MIGILDAFHFRSDHPQRQLDYDAMILSYLKSILLGKDFCIYHVGWNELPKNVDDCEGWIITGSEKAAYDEDAWIRNLGAFVQRCHAQKAKLLGICFGYQLIAHYLGGKTERSAKGVGLGVRSFNITSRKPWMHPELSQAALMFYHFDQVTQLPPEADALASDDFCQFQMFSIGSHIFGMQGHPEYSLEFLQKGIEADCQELGDLVCEKALQSMAVAADSQTIGQWIYHFFQM